MRQILLLLIVFVLLLSCSRESKEPLWEPQSHLNSKVYNGGLFPVWIELREPVKDLDIVSWRTGNSRVAKRTQSVDANTNLIKADTIFLYWDTPPKPTIAITQTDSAKFDTTYYYRDTIFAIVDGLESFPIVIEVKNILPRIKSISIDGLERPGDSILTITAHPGYRQKISIRLEKPFNNTFHPIVAMPEIMNGIRLIEPESTDSLWVYEWTPTEIIADSTSLQIKDSGGHGERLYKIRLIVYTESGSVWAASENELVKYSYTGTEVARISNGFNSISAIAVNSNDGKLYVTDQSNNTFAIYNTYGKQLYKNNMIFRRPTGVAVNVEGRYVWVADETGMRRFTLDGDSLRMPQAPSDDANAINPADSTYGYGTIRGLAVDQFGKDFVWFAIPQIDTIGYINDLALKYLPNKWNRPSMVSLDPATGMAWIADSSRIVAIDTSGKILASIKGFDFVSSISAGKNSVWVTDIEKGRVYRFIGPFTGNAQDTTLTIINGMTVEYKFLSPASVSALAKNGDAWVVAKEAGQIIRLDSLGHIMTSTTGLKLPYLSATLQIAE
ncbi:MAG: hypothetical protein FWB90_04750 [Fibromonadales bacterium]|nr:hypothetical protein [Fibromonadales bacterium]